MSACELCGSDHFRKFPYYDYSPSDRVKNSIKRGVNFLTRSQRYKLPRESEIFAGRQVIRCEKCGFAAVAPRASADDLMRYYAASYGQWKRTALPSINEIRPENQFAYLKNKNILSGVTSCLEFGAAGAGLLRRIGNEIPLQRAAVVEPGPNWHKLYGSSEIRLETHSSIFEVQGNFNLLVSSHSLEHVEDFDAYFRKMLSLVPAPGKLFFEVPNCDDDWYAAHGRRAPHTVFFSTSAIKSIAKNYDLNLIDVSTFGTSWFEEKHPANGLEYAPNPKGRYLRFIAQNRK